MPQTETIYNLYKNTEIVREKNKHIENIADFLAQAGYLQKTGQYFKHSLNKTLKINIDQETLNFFNDENNIDYLSVKNPDDTYPVYYFVNGKKWIAEKTIELELTLDTIQTFTYNNYELSEKTSVIRQHENRFLLTTEEYMRRKIDRVNEGLPEPVLYKQGKSNVLSEEGDYSEEPETIKMYLIYAFIGAAADMKESSPVSCLACFDEEKTVYTKEFQFDLSGLQDGYSILITPQSILSSPIDEVRGRIYLRETGQNDLPIYVENGRLYTVRIYKTGNDTFAQPLVVDLDSGIMGTSGNYYQVTSPRFVSNSIYSQFCQYVQSTTVYFSTHNYNQAVEDLTIQVGTLSNVPHVVKSIFGRPQNEFGRDDPRIQKIIELPYPVISKDANGKYTTMGTDFVYNGLNEFLIIYNVAHYSFKKRLHHEDVLFNNKSGFNRRPTAIDEANIENESKLFNSQFFYKKFVYDVASKPFRLENYCYNDQSPTEEVYTDFMPTTTGNSKIAFKFVGASEVGSLEDYEDTLVASRNNQTTVFSNAYFNYMKLGYNYDKEQRTRQTVTSGVVSGLQLIGAIAAFAASPATGGTSAAAGVALATSAVASAVSTTANYINSEAAQEQKMRELQNQAGNMGAADDLDLINAISGNKANIITYGVSNNVREALYTLFRYYGYKSNKRGDPTDFSDQGMNNERYWYNFVQCEPVYKSVENLSDEILNDITQRYKEGVTFFHERSGEYDMSQEKENWETFLIGHRDPDDPENPLESIVTFIGERTSDGGHWLMTPPVYGHGTAYEANADFQYLVFKGNTGDPQYYFTAEDRFGNTYKFEPANAYKCKITMTRQLDGREFTKEIDATLVYKFSGIFKTVGIPWTTSIAEPFEFSLEAQYI